MTERLVKVKTSNYIMQYPEVEKMLKLNDWSFKKYLSIKKLNFEVGRK